MTENFDNLHEAARYVKHEYLNHINTSWSDTTLISIHSIKVLMGRNRRIKTYFLNNSLKIVRYVPALLNTDKLCKIP